MDYSQPVFTNNQLIELLNVSRAIYSSLDLDKVLEQIITITTRMLDSEASSLLLIDEPTNKLIFKTATGSKAHEVSQFSLKMGEGIAGYVAETGKPLLLNDVSKNKHFSKEISDTIKFPTNSILCVPITLEGKIIGVIEVINKKDGEFSDSDTQLAKAISEQASMAIRNARLHRALSSQYTSLKQSLKIANNFIGNKSQNTQNLMDLIKKVSPADSTLLIYGETGSGKELVARMIHDNSKRKDFPFVCVTCAILTETLLESELFGHEKGSFTGATIKKIGKFEMAHRGTVFLDEISAIPLSTQTKLLRVLQEKEFERVGGNETIKVNIRIIAATNETLENLVKQGKFREDLYYRLKVIEVPVPALREHKEDIPDIVEYYLKQYSDEMTKKMYKTSKEAMDILMNYNWPGNVRELRNVIERAVVLGSGDTLLPEHLSLQIKQIGNNASAGKTTDWSLESAEKSHIEKVLTHTEGNKAKAAKLLGVSRNRLDRKLKE